MVDVFLSYSKQDRLVAEALASDLDALGIYVWWDLELYAGEDFHDRILAVLDIATAVAVIWSDTAARSSWVRDEATRALRQDKLVTTCVPGFDLGRIPLGFGQRHCVNVEDRDQVLRALGKLKIRTLQERTEQGDVYAQREQQYERWAAAEQDPKERRRLTSMANLSRMLGRSKRERVVKFLGEHPVTGGPIQVRGNRFGFYLKHRAVNASIPKHIKLEDLTLNQAVALLDERVQKGHVR